MQIVKVDAYPVRMRLRRTFSDATAQRADSSRVIVRIGTDDGLVGLGEASAMGSGAQCGETVHSITYAIRNYYTEYLIGQSPFNLESVSLALESRLALNRYARSAIDMALCDLMGKFSHLPVHMLIGGRYRNKVEGVCEITMGRPDEMVKEAQQMMDLGYRSMKLKVGDDLSRDLERMKTVREAVGDDVTIGVDPNQSWSRFETIKVVREMEKYNLAFVEQPVQTDDYEGLREVTAALDTPVIPDECVRSTGDVLSLIRLSACDAFNLKIMRVGGITEAKRISQLAAVSKLSCKLGSAMETGIGIAANVHLAASMPNLLYGAEALQSALWLEDDVVVESPEIESGCAPVPTKPGLGVELNERKVEKYALKL